MAISQHAAAGNLDGVQQHKITISDRTAEPAECHLEWSALPVGFAIFGLLWILHIPLRDISPDKDDISQYADSLLVAPGAHWQNWFTRGYSHSFDLYPAQRGICKNSLDETCLSVRDLSRAFRIR